MGKPTLNKAKGKMKLAEQKRFERIERKKKKRED